MLLKYENKKSNEIKKSTFQKQYITRFYLKKTNFFYFSKNVQLTLFGLYFKFLINSAINIKNSNYL